MGVVLLVRHGQASFGADDYDVLSETGWEQSRLLGAWLAERKVAPDVVWRGAMRRHRETAEGMLAGAAWEVPVEVDPGWDEFDHLGVVAAFPGAPAGDAMRAGDRREFQRLFERATARWSAGGHDEDYPESYPAFLARVRAALDRACAAAGPGGTVVAVSSGGPIAAACAALVDPTGEDPAVLARLWARFNTVTVNSSVTRVVVGPTGPRLLTFNEHPHLEGEHLTYR
ncbi:histidine phosphatase family protein [Nocardioides panaciterrulae]|uniref:Broad specificity phosphatase PhoE n=1 Tax=Nocardioides panaciterrulae TaxID=661492 RepID=A0A7Y9E351_9ACTN|nr:histidine phosphatase family protein [Nocardioides panaciterrulae]NYD40137.1 broad specificity phosphatase PhoE [Nocardioides panaciterrulae]